MLLGDAIAAVTKRLGIRECPACTARRVALNDAQMRAQGWQVVYVNPPSKQTPKAAPKTQTGQYSYGGSGSLPGAPSPSSIISPNSDGSYSYNGQAVLPAGSAGALQSGASGNLGGAIQSMVNATWNEALPGALPVVTSFFQSVFGSSNPQGTCQQCWPNCTNQIWFGSNPDYSSMDPSGFLNWAAPQLIGIYQAQPLCLDPNADPNGTAAQVQAVAKLAPALAALVIQWNAKPENQGAPISLSSNVNNTGPFANYYGPNDTAGGQPQDDDPFDVAMNAAAVITNSIANPSGNGYQQNLAVPIAATLKIQVNMPTGKTPPPSPEPGGPSTSGYEGGSFGGGGGGTSSTCPPGDITVNLPYAGVVCIPVQGDGAPQPAAPYGYGYGSYGYSTQPLPLSGGSGGGYYASSPSAITAAPSAWPLAPVALGLGAAVLLGSAIPAVWGLAGALWLDTILNKTNG